MLALATTRQGDVPLFCQALDGNASDTVSLLAAVEELAEQLHAIACVLGFACRERHSLLDPDAPSGPILLPTDPAVVSVLHQFAIDLLALPRDCPDELGCACNDIRARFNMAPPDHEQPTDALSLQDLRKMVERKSRAADPYGKKVASGPLT